MGHRVWYRRLGGGGSVDYSVGLIRCQSQLSPSEQPLLKESKSRGNRTDVNTTLNVPQWVKNIYSLHLLICINKEQLKSEDWPNTFEFTILFLQSSISYQSAQKLWTHFTPYIMIYCINTHTHTVLLMGLWNNNCKIKNNSTLTHPLKRCPWLVLQNIIHVSTVPKSRCKTGMHANPVCQGQNFFWCIVKCETTKQILNCSTPELV